MAMNTEALQQIANLIGAAVAHAVQQTRDTLRPPPPVHLQLPVYDGKEDLSAWISELTIKFTALGIIQDAERIAWCKTALSGVALQHVQMLTDPEGDQPITTWTALMRALEDRFIPKNQCFYLREKLAELKQKSGDIQRYLYDFNALTAKINATKVGNNSGALSEVEKMYAFLQGLHPKTKQAMLQKNPTDLARLVELTLIHEQALHTVTSNVTSNPARVVRQASTDDLARQLEQLRINVVQLQQQEQQNDGGSTLPGGKPEDEQYATASEESEEEEEDLNVNAFTNHKFQKGSQSFNPQPFRNKRKMIRRGFIKKKLPYKTIAVCARCGTSGHYASECRRTYEECQKLKTQQKGKQPLKGLRPAASGQL